MAHLKLNTSQWLELGKKLGYIKKAQEDEYQDEVREEPRTKRECSSCGKVLSLRSGTICDSCADRQESPWQE